MSTQYSPETEAYTASVVAVGGEWPGRVAILRQNYPNNETAFRASLEKYVYAAHQAQRQQAQQPQGQSGSSQQHAPSTPGAAASPGLSGTPATATTLSFPGGKSYPGQQAAPPPAIPSNAAQTQSSHPNSAGYIPYAREQKLTREPSTRAGAGEREVTTPSTSSNNAYATRRSQASVSTNSSYLNSSNANNASNNSMNNVLNRSTQPRTSSSLNPAASSSSTTQSNLRTPKLPPAVPVHKSREPLPPYFPIAPGQAYMTTYPSRLRLGLTNLMQPVTGNGTVVSATSATAHSATTVDKENKKSKLNGQSKRDRSEEAVLVAASSTLGSRRTRTKVDYTEKIDIPQPETTSDSDDDEEEEEEEAEEDTKLSRAQRALKRSGVPIAALASTSASTSARNSPAPGPNKKRKRDAEKAGEDSLGGGGRTWLGQDPPAELVLVQPARRHFLPYVDEKELLRKGKEKAMYVPIRIDLDTETHRIRDTFTWNLNESSITPELFTRIFCLDADLPFETYGSQIIQSIQSQLDSSTGVAEVSLLTPEQELSSYEADLRVILNLDLQIGTLHLLDRIEWDLTSSGISPEEFAKTLCADLGLGGEAVMLVSHAIHEELLRLKREVVEMGILGRDSAEAASGGRGEKGPKKLESVWRDWNEAKMFGPHVEILSPEDIDALENEKERNPRRMRKGDPRWQAQAANRERAGRRRL